MFFDLAEHGTRFLRSIGRVSMISNKSSTVAPSWEFSLDHSTRSDEAVRGHLSCGFLALCLKWELESDWKEKGPSGEWAEIMRGMENLQQVEVLLQGSRFLLRSELKGQASQPLRAAEVALPPVLQEVA
jgi:hypothetical protein